MAGQKPSLWKILSDSSRIISSHSLHFLALSSLFIFPVFLLNIVYTLTVPPTPFHSHYGRLLSTVSNSNQEYSDIPPIDKSQILFQFLYGLLLLLFNLSSIASVTTSVFNGFHNKPLKLSSSLKSVLSSFFPLLATKIAYIIIMAAIIFGFSLFTAFVFIGLVLLGFEIEPSSNKSTMAFAFVISILFIVMFVYLGVKLFLMNVAVVVESTYGFAAFERSSNLVKGKRGVALLMLLLFSVFNIILSVWYTTLARAGSNVNGGSYCNGFLVLQMLVYGGLSTISSLFFLAANTVFFVYCKAFNGESTLPSYDKLGEVYVPLPRDVVDDV